ncbi:sigma-70 family RNA polymerase sigma factor [Streptomyces sp. NPDC006516]|uniref:sigma-70 family RNA polymerase sigma factor n=1 Tax=Streptomyces sp. NPDC006516 TaxID=3154309 RepID=UPI0033A8EC6E
MDAETLLARRFEEHRGRLRAMAYRVLGSATEAEDAVQEAWLRLGRVDESEIENLGGWLTTVVGRISLNLLRARETRREDPWQAHPAGPAAGPGESVDPEHEALLAESVGRAMLVVLDTLSPAERLAFVLHDMFAVPFEDIAAVLERTPASTRQLASRARRRVQGADPAAAGDTDRRRGVVDAFLAASRGGDFEALLTLLAPDVVLRADPAALLTGASAARGASAVANTFVGQAKAAQPALVDGVPGLVWAPGGRPRAVITFVFDAGTIVALDMLADQGTIAALDLQIL